MVKLLGSAHCQHNELGVPFKYAAIFKEQTLYIVLDRIRALQFSFELSFGLGSFSVWMRFRLDDERG